MNLLAPVDSTVDAAANAWDMSPLGPGLSDRTPTPSSIIDISPQGAVRRDRLPRQPTAQSPVLLVPPLAAPARCFDLRRGCSLAEHLISLGYPTYLVDYGAIGFADRQLGLEHWVEDVIPNAVDAVRRDAGGDCDVQVVGWCLGGIMAMLGVAGQSLPVSSGTLIASPFDFSKVRGSAPIRQLAELTGGRVVTALYQALGGAPAPLVSLGFQMTALDKRITKPFTVLRNLHDREMLAHIEAVDEYMAHMLAYPGRTFGQLYHRFFRVNDLADGRVELEDGNVIDVANVKVPVLVVGGAGDVLAPADAGHHVVDLLAGAPDGRAFTFTGGHLGVLTGRGARNTTWRHLDKFLRDYDRRRIDVVPAPASWLPTRAAS